MVRTLAAGRANLTEAQAEIERLRLVIQKLQRSQFGRRAERLDDDQLRLGFDDLNADIGRVEAKLPSAMVKTPRSRTDRPSLPAHLPREDIRLDLEHQACPCCGGRSSSQCNSGTRSVPLEAGTDAGDTTVRGGGDCGCDPAHRGAQIMTLLPRGVKANLAFGFIDMRKGIDITGL
jgi:hypothetical protein